MGMGRQSAARSLKMMEDACGATGQERQDAFSKFTILHECRPTAGLSLALTGCVGVSGYDRLAGPTNRSFLGSPAALGSALYAPRCRGRRCSKCRHRGRSGLGPTQPQWRPAQPSTVAAEASAPEQQHAIKARQNTATPCGRASRLCTVIGTGDDGTSLSVPFSASTAST